MYGKNNLLAPVRTYTYSKCPTLRNAYSEQNSCADRNQSINLIPDHIKGDVGTGNPASSESISYTSPRFELQKDNEEQEIIVSSLVFQGLTRLHKRDGAFLQSIGALRIKE